MGTGLSTISTGKFVSFLPSQNWSSQVHENARIKLKPEDVIEGQNGEPIISDEKKDLAVELISRFGCFIPIDLKEALKEIPGNINVSASQFTFNSGHQIALGLKQKHNGFYVGCNEIIDSGGSIDNVISQTDYHFDAQGNPNILTFLYFKPFGFESAGSLQIACFRNSEGIPVSSNLIGLEHIIQPENVYDIPVSMSGLTSAILLDAQRGIAHRGYGIRPSETDVSKLRRQIFLSSSSVQNLSELSLWGVRNIERNLIRTREQIERVRKEV